MKNLPVGWVVARLGEVAEVQGGIQKQPSRRPVSRTAPFLRVANVPRGHLDLTDVHKIEIFDGELERYRLHPGDLLVVEGNGSVDQIGRGVIWSGEIADCVHQNHLIRLRPSLSILPAYLAAYWNAPATRRLLVEVASSTSGLYTLSTAKVKSIPIPVAPMPEQHRVIAAIEALISRLDAAEAGLRRSMRRLETLQTTMLATAIDNAWPVVSLGDLLREPLRNGHSAKRAAGADGLRTLTLTAVTRSDFSESNIKITVADPGRVKDLWLEPGDILVERSNTPQLVGTAALYTGPSNWAIFPDLLIRVRVSDRILPQFLNLVLKTPVVRGHLRRVAQGISGSMPKIDQAALAALAIPLPDLQSQREAMERMESLSSLIGAMANEINRALRRSSILRGSILAHAFSGRLVTEDVADGSDFAAVIEQQIGSELGRVPTTRRAAPIHDGMSA